MLGGLVALVAGCGKVRLNDVGASFVQADATWFEVEETLFVFYQVDAAQGLGSLSQVELRYTTDDEIVDWTPITELPTVHTHVPVDCGVESRCGSTSLHVTAEPREVELRLRYHPDGELHLDANIAYFVQGAGQGVASRSFVVYGVFDASNRFVQWRGRHEIPNVRNRRAQQLGLRRDFTVREQRYATLPLPTGDNPYGYALGCPGTAVRVSLPEITTNTRAVFNASPLPVEAGDASGVCAEVSVRDGTGSFTSNAFAYKNPETRSAYPELRSPIREATVLPFFLEPCSRVISEDHAAMQRQRLQMEGVESYCTEEAGSPGFEFQLAVAFLEAIEQERPAGNDMVLVIGVNQDDPAVSDALERALANVLPRERQRSSPRVSGAFVFDSESRLLEESGVEQTALWCPATVRPSVPPNASTLSCPTLPDDFGLILGPLEIDALPILPPRVDYLEFIEDFSRRQAGSVDNLRFLTPEFPTTAEHTDLGDFGVATFLNGETITADADDAFSFCRPEGFQPFVVRTDLMQNPQLAYLLADYCLSTEPTPTDSGLVTPVILPPGIELPTDNYGIGGSICDAILLGLLPIESLPDWHGVFAETEYKLGLFWEFPFLLKMDYEAVIAASVSAFGVSVPFGFARPDQALYGAEVWEQDVFPIDPTLTQCRRFCDHATFDGAGVYQVRQPFRTTYAQACYLPRFQDPLDYSRFPLDP